MRFSTTASLLLPTLGASHALLNPTTGSLPQPEPTTDITERSSAPPVPSATTTPSLPSPTPTTTTPSDPEAAPPSSPQQENLELRAIVVDPIAPATPVAPAPSITTQWVETTIKGTKTWVPVTITFTFAAVPSQAPMPGKGEIGMGTLTVKVATEVKGGAMRARETGWVRKGVLGIVGVMGVVVALGV